MRSASASLAEAFSSPPDDCVLAALPPAHPALLADAQAGDRYVVMDCMGPGEALATVRAVADVPELELVDVAGVTQRIWLGAGGRSHLGRWYAVRAASHPVDELASLAAALQPDVWPRGLVAVPTRISGTAFFPGGSGLWRPTPERLLPSFPVGGVLVVGHDFGTCGQYAAAMRAGHEPVETNPTWRDLTESLNQADIPLSNCFFTNAYLGLRVADSPTGALPGGAAETLRDMSLQVLRKTIALQQPRLIVTLGRFVPPLLARLAPTDLAHWLSARSLRDIDAVGPLRRQVHFGEALTATVVALTHPSFRSANAHRRRSKSSRADQDVDRSLLAEAYGTTV